MGSINSHKSVFGSGVKSSNGFRYIREFFSYKEVRSEQPEVLKTFPSFKADEDEFTDYILLQDDVEQKSKARWDEWKSYSHPVLQNSRLMTINRSANNDVPELPLEVKREQFYARYRANYSSPKGQWLDSKL